MSDLLTEIEAIARAELDKFRTAQNADFALSLDDVRKLDVLASVIINARKNTRIDPDSLDGKSSDELERMLRGE